MGDIRFKDLGGTGIFQFYINIILQAESRRRKRNTYTKKEF